MSRQNWPCNCLVIQGNTLGVPVVQRPGLSILRSRVNLKRGRESRVTVTACCIAHGLDKLRYETFLYFAWSAGACAILGKYLSESESALVKRVVDRGYSLVVPVECCAT